MQSSNLINQAKLTTNPSSKINYFKIEVYPDRFSHIKTTRLEYPVVNSSIPVFSTPSFAFNKFTNDENIENNKILNTATTTTTTPATSAKPPLKTRKCRPRNSLRYMTQPVTLIEIKETEEEPVTAPINNQSSNNTVETSQKNYRLKLSNSFDNE